MIKGRGSVLIGYYEKAKHYLASSPARASVSMLSFYTGCFCCIALACQPVLAQETREIALNPGITTDSVIKALTDWSRYPSSYKADQNYIFNYTDPYYGNVPMRLYVPKTYNSLQKWPLIVLLHGAVRLSSFARADRRPDDSSARNESDDDDLFFNYFRDQGYLILRPVADVPKKFDWVINDFNSGFIQESSAGNVNLTFRCIINAIIKLKKNLNIDDNKVFAFGHSDGSDGAFALEVFQPSLFAGFLLYNSMLANLKATNIYPANMQNCSTYIVHSDLDDLRAFEQTTAIVDSVRKLGAQIEYKVYNGYKHFDNHLKIDLPFANQFIRQTTRNPFPSKIYWEASNAIDNRCFWLKVDSFDLDLPAAAWQKEFNVKIFLRSTMTWKNIDYYQTYPGYVIKASYYDNTFTVECSKVVRFEILISEKMVDLNQPIRVVVNGKLVFSKRIGPNRPFISSSFEQNFDRGCIWVNSITLNASGH